MFEMRFRPRCVGEQADRVDICLGCGGEGIDEDENPCEACEGSGVFAWVED